MSRKMVWLLFALPCVLLSFMFASGQPQLGKFGMTEHRLYHVTTAKFPEPINVVVGDMVQFQPFRYPVTSKFIDAKLKVELKGGRVLELVGQSSSIPDGEGRSGMSAFLYVQAKGRTEVTIKLVGADEKDIPGYRASYNVDSTVK